MKKNKITYLIVATTIATQILPVGSIISNAQQVESKVATVREGKTIGLSNNVIEALGLRYNFYGQYVYQGFKIRFDTENKTFKVTDKGIDNDYMHEGFPNQTYFKIDLYGSDGTLKDSVSLQGNQTVELIERNLNGKHFEYGDYIKIYHREGYNRLKIQGDVINATTDFSQGTSPDILNSNCFKITRKGLVEVNIHNILKNEISILGRQYRSGKQGFRVRVDMTTGKMIVDKLGVEHAKMNLKFKGKEYIRFDLMRDGKVIDSLSLNGDDKVDKALLLEEMNLNLGDQIKITHAESGPQFKVSGTVGNASQENMQEGVNKKTITFALTENGLSEVN